VNSSADEVALVPDGVVTTTSTVPAAVVAGLVAAIEVAESTVYEVAGVLPKRTAVAPVNPVPEMVTTVPPVVGPELGERPVTVGGDAVGVPETEGDGLPVPAAFVAVTVQA
jgi:hypothetical protein